MRKVEATMTAQTVASSPTIIARAFQFWQEGRKTPSPSTLCLTLVIDRDSERPLMPVRIDGRDLTGPVELLNLLRSEIPADRAKVVSELFLGASTHNDACDRGALQQPVQGNLRDRFACLLGYCIECVHDLVHLLIRETGSL